jgi:hypothetical protein
MALLVSIQPSSILNKTANYMRVSVVRYDLKATDCLARFDLLDSTGVNIYGETISIPSNILSNWGTDDTVIPQAIATLKGLTITGYPTSI